MRSAQDKAAYAKRWYEANKEHAASYRREYHRKMMEALTPEEKLARAEKRRQRRLANYDNVRAQEIASRQRNIEKHREASRKRMKIARKSNPNHYKSIARRSAIKIKYGLTPEQIDELFRAQGSRCAICGVADNNSKRWHTDHCHSTGVVRGVLCQHCNLMIGHAKDNQTTLRNAAEYLDKYTLNLGGKNETWI